MSNTHSLVDAEARWIIQEDLDSTLYVEAGAGTGKTTNLVTRIVSIILSGKGRLQDMAAITFTEAAAAELAERIRESLEEYAINKDISDQQREQVLDSLNTIDSATIQTLHSFAGTLIRQFPIEAGVSPGFEVLDEFEDATIFQEFWAEWLDSRLTDNDTAPFFKVLISLGISINALQLVAESFWKNYDLLDHSNFPDVSAPQPIDQSQIRQVEKHLDGLLTLATHGNHDPLYSHTVDVLDVLRLLRGSLDNKYSALYLLGNCTRKLQSSTGRPYKGIATRSGRRQDWSIDSVTGENGCKLIKNILDDFQELVDTFAVQMAKNALMPVLRDLQASIVSRAEERKINGQLVFHDLLVYARNMIRDKLDIRDYYRDLYKFVLIDEFQDTDPIQAQIAAFLCEDTSANNLSSDRPKNWEELPTIPGKLFAVGDPKQSIFRFRRADVAVANVIKSSIAKQTVYLTNNFRSQEPIITWVNQVFSKVIVEGNEQPVYIPLDTSQNNTQMADTGKVKFFGGTIEARQPNIRAIEAIEAQRIIKRIISEGWMVRDMHEVDLANNPKMRPIRLDDICILSPTRTGVKSILHELDNASIPYRLESADMVFETEEISDLITCLQAIDNPKDYISIIATLKSPIFGCSDVDIFRYMNIGNSLNALEQDSSSAGLVGKSLEIIRRFYLKKTVVSVPRLIEEIIRERALTGYALTEKWPRERWRKYQLIIDKARILSDKSPTTLGYFIEWMNKQINSGVQSLESAVPDSDENAVRIMTIHRSKGLEFPLVMLVGISGPYVASTDPVIFDRDTGQAEVRVTNDNLSTIGWDGLKNAESIQFVEERKRLLYVACTRARDYLLISTHRPAKGQSQAGWLVDSLMDEDPTEYWEGIRGIESFILGHPSDASKDLPDLITQTTRQSWKESHEKYFARSRVPATVTATQLVAEFKEEHESDDEPWKKGRAGTSIGRAVHAVLQSIDISPDVDVKPYSEAEVITEGIPQHQETVVQLVKNALNSKVLERARQSDKIWREVQVMAPIGNSTIEGIIDLLFEEDGQLVVVDYKTDSLNSDEEIQRATDRYRIQGAVYAYAATKATGKQVKEVVLLFLNPNKASVLDNPANMASEVEEAISEYRLLL